MSVWMVVCTAMWMYVTNQLFGWYEEEAQDDDEEVWP
jgi:hypothetical protein